MYAVKYRFNQICLLTQKMNKLDTFTSISIKLRLSGDTCNPYQSTLVHQQYIGKTKKVVFLLFNVKYLLTELNTLEFLSAIKKKHYHGIFIPKYEESSVMPEDMCTKYCPGTTISQSTNG